MVSSIRIGISSRNDPCIYKDWNHRLLTAQITTERAGRTDVRIEETRLNGWNEHRLTYDENGVLLAERYIVDDLMYSRGIVHPGRWYPWRIEAPDKLDEITGILYMDSSFLYNIGDNYFCAINGIWEPYYVAEEEIDGIPVRRYAGEYDIEDRGYEEKYVEHEFWVDSRGVLHQMRVFQIMPDNSTIETIVRITKHGKRNKINLPDMTRAIVDVPAYWE